MEYTASAIAGIICCSIGALFLLFLPLLSWLKKRRHLASLLEYLLEWRRWVMTDNALRRYFAPYWREHQYWWTCLWCSSFNDPFHLMSVSSFRDLVNIKEVTCHCGRIYKAKWNWRIMQLDVGVQRHRADDIDGFISEHPHSDADSGETIRLQTTMLETNMSMPEGLIPSERSEEEPEEEEFNIQKDWTCSECNTVHPLLKTEQEQIIGQLKIAKRARLTKQCPSCNTLVLIRIEKSDKIDGIMNTDGVRPFRFYCGNCKTECEYKIRRMELIGIDHRSIDYRCRKCGAKLGIALQRPRQDKNEWIVKVLWCHSPKQEFERRINEGAKRKVKF